MFFQSISIVLASALLSLLSFNVKSTIVEIRTSLGVVQVNLFDNTTPQTVANFLSYANSGAYANNVVHRSVSNFVVQGGGFTYTGPVDVNNFSLDSISTGTPVANDPKLSNVRGTIAMAKTSNPDSATSQCFINLSNNSSSLDVASNSGGFTVFGEIIEGMENVDAIAGVHRCNGSSIPTPGLTSEQCSNASFVPGAENFVTIISADIYDDTVNSADSLTPVKNTSLPVTPPVTPEPPKSSSGGGSIAWFGLAFTALISIRRFLKK